MKFNAASESFFVNLQNFSPAIAGCWWCLSIYDTTLKSNLLLLSLWKIIPLIKLWQDLNVIFINPCVLDKTQQNDYAA